MDLFQERNHLSHGFYKVSEKTARKLAAPYPARYSGRPAHGYPMRMRKLPIGGMELAIEHEGIPMWLAQYPAWLNGPGWCVRRREVSKGVK